MSEKISMELWYDHRLERHIDGIEGNNKWETRMWVRIYETGGNPLGGVAVRLYATLLSAPPREGEIVIDDSRPWFMNGSELGTAISQDNGETEPILSEHPSFFNGYTNENGGLFLEAVAYDPPQFCGQSLWYVSFKKPEDDSYYDLKFDKGKFYIPQVEDGWEATSWVEWKYFLRFIGPPKKPWKAVRQWKIEEARKTKIEKAVKEIEDHVTIKSLQSYDGLLVNLSEMRTTAERIEADFTERAFAPFWDGICGFAVKIGRLEAEMRLMAQCYKEYQELCERYLEISHWGGPEPSPFKKEFLNPVDPKMLKQMTDWFRTAVRKGQTDFQFASIYEHYRTRDVLVEGFRDLVKKFTDISHALDSVNRGLINGFRELNECVGELQECIGDEFEYLRVCIEEEEKITRKVIGEEQEITRQVIEDEGVSNRQVIAISTAASEILRQKRHEELLSSFEYQQEATRQTLEDELENLRESVEEEAEATREAMEEAQERDREFAEEIENKKQERQRELLATYEYEQEVIQETLTASLDRNEAEQQERHEEVISEGKRDRKLIKDIDRQVGGKEWWKH